MWKVGYRRHSDVAAHVICSNCIEAAAHRELPFGMLPAEVVFCTFILLNDVGGKDQNNPKLNVLLKEASGQDRCKDFRLH